MPAHRSALTMMRAIYFSVEITRWAEAFLPILRLTTCSFFSFIICNKRYRRTCNLQYGSISSQHHAVCAVIEADSTGFTAHKVHEQAISKNPS